MLLSQRLAILPAAMDLIFSIAPRPMALRRRPGLRPHCDVINMDGDRRPIDALFADAGATRAPKAAQIRTSGSVARQAMAVRLSELEPRAADPAVADELSDLMMSLAEAAMRDRDLGDAVDAVRRAIALRQEKVDRTSDVGDRGRLCAAMMSLASLHLSSGDTEAAHEALQQAEAQTPFAPASDAIWGTRIVALYRMKAAIAQQRGDPAATAQALELAARNVPDPAKRRQPGDAAGARLQLLAQAAEARLAGGDFAGAQAALRGCAPLLRMAHKHQTPVTVAVLAGTVLHLRGLLAAARGRRADAELRFGEALAALDPSQPLHQHLGSTVVVSWNALRQRRSGEQAGIHVGMSLAMSARGMAARACNCCNGDGHGFKCSCAA